MAERRFRHGLILGKFYPLHVGHSHLIRTALSSCERVTVQLLGSSVESIPLELRHDWLESEHPSARVVSAVDDAPVDFDSPRAWDKHMVIIERLLDSPVDAVFTSDNYGAELARRLRAEWVQVDPGRSLNAVAGRDVRADVEGHWHLLPLSVRRSLVQRIVVVGAESTGTTTLARALAARWTVEWVEEYGRLHSEIRPGGLDTPWTEQEFEFVFNRQVENEQRAAERSSRPMLVCDTDALATAVWFERYIGSQSMSLERRAAEHPPALYILTGDEIPFVQDGMRDGEHIRGWMHGRFREVLADQPVPWIEVSGDVDARVEQCAGPIADAMARAFDFAVPLELRASD
ncbi:MAG: cytidyltransferase [Rhodoglobus sp.]|nr:cytidyltransferase [Rhodoglobus sp.]